MRMARSGNTGFSGSEILGLSIVATFPCVTPGLPTVAGRDRSNYTNWSLWPSAAVN
jgi:hypothetical protein